MYSHLGMILWCENEGFASKVTTKNTINYQAMSEHYGKVGFWGTQFSGKPLLCLYVLTTVIYQCVIIFIACTLRIIACDSRS